MSEKKMKDINLLELDSLDFDELSPEEWHKVALILSKMLKARNAELSRVQEKLELLKLKAICDEPGILH